MAQGHIARKLRRMETWILIVAAVVMMVPGLVIFFDDERRHLHGPR